MSSSPRLNGEKRRWWQSNRNMINKYIRESRTLIATQDPQDVKFAISLLDAALAISPRYEKALELKARSLLFLRRFRDVVNMLWDYIPSFESSSEDDASTSSDSSSSCSSLSRERVKILGSVGEDENGDGKDERSVICFSVTDLKRKVLAGVGRNMEREGQWRYMVLGQACCHLGMMENAMVLLQTFRRISTAALRRESLDLHDDEYSNSSVSFRPTTSLQPAMLETATNLLNQVKLLLRRKAAAVASFDAGLPLEAIRHFSKIIDSRCGTPQAFMADCFVGRAAANRAAGRLVDSIADCNRALAIDPTSILALSARVDIFESIRSLPDCLRDLDHLKLLYDAILRDRKLPGPVWRPHSNIRYGDIAGSLRTLTVRIHEMRKRVAVEGGVWDGVGIDYHCLIGVRRGCKRSELDRARLLLCLKHQPEKAAAFVYRVEFADEHRDIETVKEQARMSASILYRMLQKGHSSIMSAIIEDEKAAAIAAAMTPDIATTLEQKVSATSSEAKPVYKGVFFRDLAVVGSLLSQAGYGRTIPLKYENSVDCFRNKKKILQDSGFYTHRLSSVQTKFLRDRDRNR